MKRNLLFLLIPLFGFGQTDYRSEYLKAEELMDNQKFEAAYQKFNTLESQIPKNDTLYIYSLYYKVLNATYLEQLSRMDEKFEKSLEYGLAALDGIEKGVGYFDESFADRRYFMVKNILVSQNGLGRTEEVKRWREKMYAAASAGVLPQGLDVYYNFDYFKIGDKNIWGYEWFEDLPKDRFSTSFTKVVYYVYDTNPDGSDRNQLYRLHVLMFHGNELDFDYVLERNQNIENEQISGTYYRFRYKEDIDLEKLKKDVKQIVIENIEPDTRRSLKLDKDGKVISEIKL